MKVRLKVPTIYNEHAGLTYKYALLMRPIRAERAFHRLLLSMIVFNIQRAQLTNITIGRFMPATNVALYGAHSSAIKVCYSS